MNYAEQVAALRLQKQQEELAADYNQAVYGREESLRNRQEIERQFATTTDPAEQQALKDDWHYYDAEVQRCEQQIREKTPQQPPSLHPKIANLSYRATPYFQKYGQRGRDIGGLVHQHVTQNVGVSPDHPNYAELMRRGMEYYGQEFGCPYDRKEEALTWRDAAKISGLSPESYGHAYQQLKAQGRVK